MHALVVGGSGMLREATLSLVDRYRHVSLVARRASQSKGVHPIEVDYRETASLQAALADAVARFGPINLALCWIHSTAPEALPTIGALLAESGQPCRLFHVRGSAAADPSKLPMPALAGLGAHVEYRQVILGFQIEGDRSRWLTHGEISRGVLQAIDEDLPRSVVGVVEPWEMRP